VQPREWLDRPVFADDPRNVLKQFLLVGLEALDFARCMRVDHRSHRDLFLVPALASANFAESVNHLRQSFYHPEL
jgi:hypothetical protein